MNKIFRVIKKVVLEWIQKTILEYDKLDMVVIYCWKQSENNKNDDILGWDVILINRKCMFYSVKIIS